MTAGAFSQMSIITLDAYGSLLGSGNSVVVAHMCDVGVTNEHGNKQSPLQLFLLRRAHVTTCTVFELTYAQAL